MTDHEDWHEIDEFPDYLVSSHGNVVNIKFGGRPLQARPNQYGSYRVGLVNSDGKQQTRGLGLLVAKAFLPQEHEFFNTPIHLDGDQSNCRADNLMWRPRAFAVRYHKQFTKDTFHTDNIVRLVDISTGEEYESVKEVCIRNGLYWFDVVKSFTENTFVPITYQEFRRI